MPQTTRPPTAQALVIENSDQTAMAWVNWFHSVSDRLDACEERLLLGEARLLSSETRHTAHEARLLLGEARLLSIEARLLAAGIP